MTIGPAPMIRILSMSVLFGIENCAVSDYVVTRQFRLL
jgi:hypothetical protein